MTNEYTDALRLLLSLPDWERGTGTRPARQELWLDRPRALLNALGNPQTRYRSVLIAGTKGKGSTAAILESILRASGIKTGLYTSPHLHTYRERIRANGELISEYDFARGAGEIQPLLDDLISQHPDFDSFTTFEVMSALALNFFARQEIDVAILEVGLGGRLDATNVVDADLALITPISFDHTAVLGNTLHKIAFEKAGIIKDGKIVLSAPQAPEARDMMEQTAREKNAVLGIGERDWIWLGGHDDFLVAGVPHAGLWGEYWVWRDLSVPLLGTHQFVNAALAIAATRVMRDQWKLEIGDTVVRAGIGNVEWFGRMEILQPRDETRPLIVADGAHNGDSAEKLFDALKFHFEFEKLFLIFGMLGDKNLAEIAAPFRSVASMWTVTTNHPRSGDAETLAERLRALGIPANAAPTCEHALSAARAAASPRDLILFTGSLSLVAQARELFGRADTRDPQ